MSSNTAACSRWIGKGSLPARSIPRCESNAKNPGLPGFAERSRSVSKSLRLLFFAALLGAGVSPANAQAVSITVGPNLGSFSVGPIQIPLTATGGTLPYTWSWSTTAGQTLPNELALRSDNPNPLPGWWPPSASAAIVGVATAPQFSPPATFSLTVTDASNNSASITATISISPLTMIDNYQLPDGFLNLSYSFTPSVSGAVGGVTWALAAGNSLPPGLSINPNTGQISGTPTAPGPYGFTLLATDLNGPVFRFFNLNVNGVGFGNVSFLGTTNVGQAFSTLLNGQGGTGPYTFTGVGFPPGVGISSTGLISGTVLGTPDTIYLPSITVTDSASHSYSKQFLIEILGSYFAPNLNYPNPPDDATIGESRSYFFNGWGGVAPYQWSISGGPLPPGMSLQTNLNNVGPLQVLVTGAPTQLGTYNFIVNMTDSSNPPVTVSQPFTIQVKAATNDYPPSGARGQAYSFYLRPIGGAAPFSWSLVSGTLPAGVSLNTTTGLISGTPTENGWFNAVFSISVNGGAQTITRFIGFYVSSPTNPQVAAYGTPPDAIVSLPYSFSFNACCASGTTTFSLASGSLPAGLSLSSTGQLSGTPTATGIFTFTIQATDGANALNFGLHTVSLNVSPLHPSTPIPPAGLNQVYSTTFSATGGSGALTWTLGPGSQLPPGVTMNSNGTLSGTPTSAGIFYLNYIVTDTAGNTFHGFASINVGPATPFSQIGPNLGTFPIGEVQLPLASIGGNGTETWSLVSGTLPTGLALRSDVPPWFPSNAGAGIIGVATVPGNYSFTLNVTSGSSSSTQAFTMRITGLTVKDEWSLPDAFLNNPYSYSLTALNAAGPPTWTSNYGMPPGMTLSTSGVLSGTPTQAGFYNIGLVLNDGTDTVYWQISLNISTIQITSPGVLPNATQGSAYSYTLAASGGTGPYTFTTNSLPTGLTLDSATGVISGTVSAGPGSFYFSLTATDANRVSYVKAMSITVIGVPPTLPYLSGPGAADCSLGVPCHLTMSVFSGGTAPFTWNVTGLPPGMDFRTGSGTTLSWVGPGGVELWGIPSQLGSFNVQAVVTDANGVSATQTFPLKVSNLEVNGNDFLPNGTIGVAYSKTLRVLGGTGPYSVQMTSGALPAGVSFSGMTVSGVPVENGGFGVQFLFSDSASDTLVRPMGLFISGGSSTITINSSTIGPFLLNSPLSFPLFACCVPSYTWTLLSGTLPPGVTLSASGILSGTPTAGGTYTFLVQAADQINAANFGVRQITMTITPISITSGPLPYGNVATVYPTQALTATGGTGALTWTVASGSLLPPGLALSAAGAITGTPTATGQFYFTVRVTDAAGNFALRFFAVSVYAQGAVPPLNLPFGPNLGTFAVGALAFELAATGGAPPYHYSLTPGAAAIPGMRVQDGQPLPSYFAASATGGFLGVVAASGTYNTSIRVTDSTGNVFDRAITFTVSPLGILTYYQLPNATLNTPYSFTFTGYGGSGTYSWSLAQFGVSLPPGLSLNSAGQLSGTPTAAGSYSVPITITDPVNAVSTTVFYSIQVDPFAITSGGVLPQGTVNTAYSQTLQAPGCGTGCAWTMLASVPGLTLNATTGVLSGTPTFAANRAFQVQASGSNGSVLKSFSLDIMNSTPQPLLINTPANLPSVSVGTLVARRLMVQGGTPPYTWSVVNPLNLPPGVSLQAPGEALGATFAPGAAFLLGRAMQPGTYQFTLQVTDSASNTITQTITENVAVIQMSCCTNNLPVSGTTLVYNVPYTQALVGLGGTGTYTWSALSPLPPGLSLNSATGVISGSPTNTGFFSLQIQITDAAGNSATQFVNFNIASPTGVSISLPGPFLGTFNTGTAHVLNLNPSGGTGPYTVTALTPLPAGFALATGNQLLSSGQGSYDLDIAPFVAPGTYSFTLQVTDSLGNIGVRTLSVTIAPFDLFTGTALADGSVGTPYSQQILTWDNANPGTVSWSVTPGSALPPGLSLVGSTITGTPTTAGDYSFTLSVTDSSGVVINYGFSLHISSLTITNPNTQVISQQVLVAEPFSLTFAATGGGPTLTWSATGLPPGLVMSPSGTVSGTVYITTGAFRVTVTVTDGVSTLQRLYTLFVRYPDPTVLSLNEAATALPDAVVGQSFAYSLLPGGGVPPYTWQVAAGSTLPPGLNLYSGASLGPNQLPGNTLLEGAPTLAGSYSFDLIATDSASTQMRRTFTLNVTPVDIFAGGLNSATVGVAYSEQLTPSGGTGPYTFTYSARSVNIEMFPPGITASASGLISGTPTSTGIFVFFATAHDSVGHTYTTAYTLQVFNANGLQVTTPPPFNLTVGVGLNQTLATNQTSMYTWSVSGGALPPGMFLSTSGSSTFLTGVPAASGPFTFTLRATDNANSTNFADRVYTVSVSPMQVNRHVLPPAQQNSPYTPYTFGIAGGTPPYIFTTLPVLAPLPPGLTLSSSGTLSGTPTFTGSFSFTFLVTDSTGATVYGFATLNVLAPSATNPVQGPPAQYNIFNGTMGTPFGVVLDFSLSGGVPPFTWSVQSGSLPPGVNILQGTAGVTSFLAGIPTAAGAYSFVLQATNAAGQIGLEAFAVTVSPSGPGLPPLHLAAGMVGTAYPPTSLPVMGGAPPYTFQLVNGSSMPVGLSLSASGVLSGTPQSPGSFVLGVSVTDAAGNTASNFYPLAIDNAAGQAPAIDMSPGKLQINYVLTSPPPAPTPLAVSATSGNLAFTAMVAGIPGASLSATSGTSAATVFLNLDTTQLTTAGTYIGVAAVNAPNSVNGFAGIPITLTVTNPAPCTYALSPAGGSVSASGGTGSFAVNTGGQCAWTPTASDPTWISVTAGAGPGPGTVSYVVTQPNPASTARTGTISAAGLNYTITQFGSGCSFTISPSSISAPPAGGSVNVGITASNSACTWTASGLGATPASGTGGGTVRLTIPANTSVSQVLTATVAGQTFTVNQSGVNCVVALASSSFAAVASGGPGSVDVNLASGCSYATTNVPAWITPTSGASGSGPGPVTMSFAVAANSTTSQRSATLSIGGQPFLVTQAGVACSVTVDASSLGSPYGSLGGAGTISLTANGSNCSWTAASNAAWATAVPTSGTGNATINVTVTSNAASASARSANLTIAGQSVGIAQAGTACTYSLGSPNASVPYSGGSGAVTVTSPAVCSWTSTPDSTAPWLTITSSGSGGSSDVQFVATANPTSSPRSGVLTIAGQSFTVTEAAAPCTYTLSSTATTVASTGTAAPGTFTFSTGATGCSATAQSYASWITPVTTSTAAGGASGTVTYSVLPNAAGTTRVGTIQFAGQTFTVTQTGAACAFSLTNYGLAFNSSGGTGTVAGSQSAQGCVPAVGTTQPSIVTIGNLTGPVLNIWDLPFTVSNFSSLVTAVRFAQITFGGQIVTVKQTSW